MPHPNDESPAREGRDTDGVPDVTAKDIQASSPSGSSSPLTQSSTEPPDDAPLTPDDVEDEALRGDFMLRVCLLLLAFLFGCTTIASTPTLVHIRSGEYLAAHNFWPPRSDVFSYTATADPDQHPWINLSWLFDLSAAGVHAVGGAVGLSLVKGLLTVGMFWLVLSITVPRVSTWWGTLCGVLALLACSPWLTLQPEIITLFGTALSLRLLHRWDQTGNARLLYAYIGMLILWSNLDPRAFVGLLLLILFAIGEAVATLLDRPDSLPMPRIRHLGLTVAAGTIGLMLNPFGWHSLLHAVDLYAVYYPAMREYFAAGAAASHLQYFPITQPEFWQGLNYQTVSAVLLAVVTLVVFVLNRRHLPISHIMLFVGATALGSMATHEMGPAALILAVLSSCNAQQWYRSNFRQTFSVETSELLFSRGGRFVTVLGMFVLAFLAISGRMGRVPGHRFGVGWHPFLQATVTSLREELDNSLDPRPFNFTLPQGDLLIWIGQQPFVDHRVGLYAGTGSHDLLALHRQTRNQLRSMPPGGNGAEPDPPPWREALDRFETTHVIPRLSGANPDYETYLALLASPDWQLTRLGAAVAVFYRTDLRGTEALAYRRENGIQFLEQAFRAGETTGNQRADWPRPRSAYQSFLSRPQYDKPGAVQCADHFQMHLMLAANGRLGLDTQLAAAMAHLAIRNANAGLAVNSNSAEAFRVLGYAYAFLENTEKQIAMRRGGRDSGRRRYLQAVQSFSQLATLEPDDAMAQLQLLELYHAHQRWDLALRAVDRYRELSPTSTQENDQQVQQARQNEEFRRQLSERVAAIRQRVEEALVQSPERRLDILRGAAQSGCPLLAIELLEEQPEVIDKHPAGANFHAFLLMEIGRVEEAAQVVHRSLALSGKLPGTGLRELAALSVLAIGQYDRAVAYWREESDLQKRQSIHSLLETLPFTPQPPVLQGRGFDLWPMQQTGVVFAAVNHAPYTQARLLVDIALCHLETGRTREAGEALQEALTICPDTPLRPLIRFYLYPITGQLIDLRPNDRIPVPPRSGQKTPETPDSDLFVAPTKEGDQP